MDDFLKGEIRCEFKVDINRKMLWKIELDMMEKLDEICKKNGLKYFLLGGSAIGAIRHKGFIPWDDDFDIGMIRNDYEKFIEIAKEEFGSPYVLQYVEKDQHFDGILRIRNSETTGILRPDWNKKCNSGIFIEIYPLDKVPNTKIGRFIHYTQLRFYYGLIIRRIYSFEDSKIKKIIAGFYKRVSLEALCGKFEKCCKKYNEKNKKSCNTLTTPEAARKEHNLILLEDLAEEEKVPYEYLMLSVPVGNERILKNHYGDYMKLPPVEERGNYHNDTVYYDPFTPYEKLVGSEIVKKYFRIED